MHSFESLLWKGFEYVWVPLLDFIIVISFSTWSTLGEQPCHLCVLCGVSAVPCQQCWFCESPELQWRDHNKPGRLGHCVPLNTSCGPWGPYWRPLFLLHTSMCLKSALKIWRSCPLGHCYWVNHRINRVGGDTSALLCFHPSFYCPTVGRRSH